MGEGRGNLLFKMNLQSSKTQEENPALLQNHYEIASVKV